MGGASLQDPAGITAWENFDITLVDHDKANQDLVGNTRFGNDYIAGGAASDQIFGQLGNDTIQGDGSIDLTVSAVRDASGNLVVAASAEDATDGDDYIEGNGGNDAIFGNLGQDDIIGGSSELFSLNTPAKRPDGADLVFGGAGSDIARNNEGDLHGRDADVILGDNGNIYRLTGTAGFSYDNAYDQQIVVRATKVTLDYTPGGPDMVPTSADIGAGDELHGESGDDVIYGQTGNDVLFGEGQDDDLIGGWGHDWISGGTGQDGVLGDDGRIFTSRNGTAEALYGLAATVQSDISTPGDWQQATINVTGQLKKSVDLTPFNPVLGGTELSDPSHADDIIYGGLGSDWLHGGAGDDAMSGAEALPAFYGKPANAGDVLAYNETTGEFAAYDEFNPRTKIGGFVLNFDPLEGTPAASATYGTVYSDGNDAMFGDLGNDWLVGGTGRDNLYGGWGDDLLNADDNHDLNPDAPDTHPSYEDRAYGGAGRDRLIANTGGDRLIDWAGEFNSYIVPFSPFGLGTVSRMLAPGLAEYLYDLSEADGADFTRGGDAARNGEPFGELGLVKQQDFAWRDQTGAPDDPQPGNIPGGKRDVLRSAGFDDPAISGFQADSGSFSVEDGSLRVTATSSNGDAVSVFHVGEQLPSYFELQASVMIQKPTGGWKGNAYVIFDYQSEQDFKFAGIDESINKLVVGHRDASGWHVDKQGVVTGGVKADKFYNMLVAVNGTTVTLLVDNKTVFTHTYQPRVIDGYVYGLNYGYVGVGSDQSRGNFDNIRVQVLPPQVTFDNTESFADGVANLFTAGSTGVWSVAGQRYTVTPAGGAAMSLLDLGPDHLNHGSLLEMTTKVNTQGRAGIVFDRYGDDSFKWAAIDAAADKLLIGHYTKKGGWVVDASMAVAINAGQDYTLGVSLKGTTVSATLAGANGGNFIAMAGHAFNASTVDGNFGLMAVNGAASFDDVRVKTDDAAFVQGVSSNMEAAATALVDEVAGDVLTLADLDALASVAISEWTQALGAGDPRLAGMVDVRMRIGELAGGGLGHFEDGELTIDADAAGHGWFVDLTPADAVEFSVMYDRSTLRATEESDAFGRMDLLTVLMHELGHAIGFLDNAAGYAVMHEDLEPGVRFLLDELGLDGDPDQPVSDAALAALAARAAERAPQGPRFDFDLGAPQAGTPAGIDWNASAGGWTTGYTPYVAPEPKSSSNFSDYLVKLFKRDTGAAGYDSLGKSLMGGKDGAKGGAKKA